MNQYKKVFSDSNHIPKACMLTVNKTNLMNTSRGTGRKTHSRSPTKRWQEATTTPTQTHLAYLGAYHSFVNLGWQEVAGDGPRLQVGVWRGNNNSGGTVHLRDLLLLARHHHHLLHRQAGPHDARQLGHDVWNSPVTSYALLEDTLHQLRLHDKNYKINSYNGI